ncbi:MAG TPA: 50S ribosomal protein L4 [Vitreimonas sp.]|nr:50S ribosomal protein L4 [Vitreimonas sp.]
MKVTHVTSTGKHSELALNDAVFGAPANLSLLSQAVRVYQSNLRQGSSKVKTRSEINRTKKKWFKQKGTGNARHGARTSNIFVGGGVSHGPNGEQNWSLNMSQTMKHQALVNALSIQASKIVVHDGLSALGGKTAEAMTALKAVVEPTEKVLVIIHSPTLNIIRGLRNVETVLVTQADRVTALEVSLADRIVLTSEAITTLEKRLTAKPTKPAAKTVAATSDKAVKAETKAQPVAKAAKPAAKKAATAPKAEPKKAATKKAAPKKEAVKAKKTK